MYNDLIFKNSKKSVITRESQQRSYQDLQRPLQNLNTTARLFAPIIPKFLTLLTALKLRQPLPIGFTQDVGFWTAFKRIFSDPNLTEGFIEFCQSYPQIAADLKLVNAEYFKTLVKTPFNQLANTFNQLFVPSDIGTSRSYIQNKQISNVDSISDAVTKGDAVLKEFQDTLQKLNPEIESYIQTMDRFQLANGGKQSLIPYINNIGELKSNIQYNLRLINDPQTKQYLSDILNEISKLPNSTTIKNGTVDLIQSSEDFAKLGQLFDPNKTQIVQASADGMETAGKLSKIFPALARFTSILGLLFSIPSAFKWGRIIKDGQFGEKMQDADERANFAVDLSNLVSSAIMFIPGLQPVAMILSGLSLGIQGGQAIIHSTVGTNQQDQLINTNTQEEREKLINKMQKMDQYNIQNQDWWVDKLFEDIQPGYSGFNDYVDKKFPKKIDPSTNKPTSMYDPSKVKTLDLLNNFTQWLNTLPENEKKNYSWFLNPTDKNKQMKAQFLQKLNNWKNSQQTTTQKVSFNLKNHKLSATKA